VLKLARERYQVVNNHHVQNLLARWFGIVVCHEGILYKRLRAVSLKTRSTMGSLHELAGQVLGRRYSLSNSTPHRMAGSKGTALQYGTADRHNLFYVWYAPTSDAHGWRRDEMLAPRAVYFQQAE
jgi:hypothetical protein